MPTAATGVESFHAGPPGLVDSMPYMKPQRHTPPAVWAQRFGAEWAQRAWAHNTRLWPLQKLEWKPRQLAQIWVHGLAPHNWSPMKWITGDTSIRLWRSEIRRFFINKDAVPLLTMFLGIQGMAFWIWRKSLFEHSSTKLGTWITFSMRPYVAQSRWDMTDYRHEGGPFPAQGGGRFHISRYRTLDTPPQFYGWVGYKQASGLFEIWNASDPRLNPLARNVARDGGHKPADKRKFFGSLVWSPPAAH